MTTKIRYTAAARGDLKRFYRFLLETNPAAADRALRTIEKSAKLLQLFPFSCRQVHPDNPFLRELLVSFGSDGYVALYQIEIDLNITILAIRHQREDDYLR